MRLDGIKIVKSTQGKNGKIVKAVTLTDFGFKFGGQWISTTLKSEISLRVRPNLAESKIAKKIKAAAWADVRAYMNGDEIGGEKNIFNSIAAGCSNTPLSDDEEYELEEQLLRVERGW